MLRVVFAILLIIISQFTYCQSNHIMLSEYIHNNPNAPIMVIFGGNPAMRHQVVSMLAEFNKVTVYAALSEKEGLELLQKLPKVDFVLIGGRYTEEQRIRIRKFVKENLPNTFTSEPGIDYPYGDEGVKKDLIKKLNLQLTYNSSKYILRQVISHLTLFFFKQN